MDWKKNEYLITIKYDDNNKIRKYVKGVTANVGDLEIGIHKSESKDWIVTDTSTGFKLYIADTQKAAKAWVEKYEGLIRELLTTPKHAELIKEVEQCGINL